MVCLLTAAARLHLTPFLDCPDQCFSIEGQDSEMGCRTIFNRTDCFDQVKNMKVTKYCMFLQNDEFKCFQYKLIFLLEAVLKVSARAGKNWKTTVVTLKQWSSSR